MEKPTPITEVVVCRREGSDKTTGHVNVFGYGNRDYDKHYLFRLNYEEIDELVLKLLQAKAVITKERATK